MKYFALFLVLSVSLTLVTCADEVYFAVLAGNYLNDLYTPLEGSFQLMTQNWTINNYNDTFADKKTNCSSVYILGGESFDNFYTLGNSYFVSKQYDSLPNHNVVYFVMDLYLRSLPVGKLRIEIDGQQVFSANVTDLVMSELPLSYCNENPYKVFNLPGKIAHNSKNLTLKVISDGKWKFGIRDVKMRFANDSDTSAITPCMKKRSSYGTEEGACNCPSGKTNSTSSGTCLQCDLTCSQCFGPSPSDCFGCAPGYVYDPTSKTCIACDLDCLLCTGPGSDQCLQCSSFKYLLIDNTCSSHCDPAFKRNENGTFRTCDTPCSSLQYYLEDGTCTDTCNSPLLNKTVGFNKLCKSPCQPSNYIYPNGSCYSSCPVNTTKENGFMLCGCSLGLVMLSNGSCVEECPYPYQPFGDLQVCDNPCPEDHKYFYQKDELCRAECDPSQVQESFICLADPPSDELDTQQEQTLAPLTSGLSSFSSTLGIVATLGSSSNPSALLLTSFAEMTGYIKYLKIDYPSQLQDALDQDSGSLFIPEASESLRKQIVNSTLPEKFEEYNTHSSFLVNFYSSLITLLILAAVTGIVLLIKACKKNKEAINNIKETLMWNFSLPFFSTMVGKIVLYSSFEFRTAGSISGFLSVLSMLICCVFYLIVIATLAKMFIVVRTRWTKILKAQNPNNGSVETIKASLNPYQVLFDSYKDRFILQQAFMFIFVARVYIYVTIIAYLYEYPLAQSILLMLLSFFMLAYLIITRPFLNRIDLGSYLFQEVSLFIVLICTVSLASIDSTDPANDNARSNLGDVILRTNFVFTLISSLYTIKAVAPTVKGIFKKCLSSCKKKEVAPSAPAENPKQIQIKRKTDQSLDQSQIKDSSRQQLFTVKPSDVSFQSNFSHRVISADMSYQSSHRDRVAPSADTSFQSSFIRRVYPVKSSQLDL